MGFVHDTLEDIRVPYEFIELVWHCISSPSIKVLRNGEDLDRFATSYGIRQGDLLSLYIFMLCIVRLSQIVNATLTMVSRNPSSYLEMALVCLILLLLMT